MSKVVFQSCLDTQQQQQQQLMETRTLKLKLASPKPCFFESYGEDKSHYQESSSSYVHPMAKRSPSALSDKSLELCTENLGSETGSDICESSIFSISSPVGESPAKPRQEVESSRKVIKNSPSFPPPLTTMAGGSSSLQVWPHRVGGRLVIEAVEVPPPHTHLQAERSHGRLRLSFQRDCSNSSEEDDEEYETENNEATHEEEDAIEEEEEEFEFEEEEEEELGSEVHGRWEDMDGNNLEVGVEMGIEKFQRPSRCKESGHDSKGLCNWEPVWVATS